MRNRVNIWLAAIVLAGLCLPTGCVRTYDLITEYKSGTLVAAEYGVLFYADDVLALPGHEVTLQTHLRTPHAFHGIANVTVTYSLDGKPIGSAITNKDGVASIRYRAAAEGDYHIHAQPTKLPPDVDSEDVGALKNSYDLLLSVRPAGQKFIVVDLDHTLVNEGGVKVLTTQPPQLPHSAEVLGRLADTYSVIYLTGRPNSLTRKSRLWLDKNKFPSGVLMTCGKGRSADAGAFKNACLATWRRDFPNIVFGVGDLCSDVDAYLANGIAPYLLRPWPADTREKEDLLKCVRELKAKDRTQVARDWLEIEEGIVKGKRLSPDDFIAKLEAAH